MRTSTHIPPRNAHLDLSRAFTTESRPQPSPTFFTTTSHYSLHREMIKKPIISILDWDDTLCPTTWLHFRGLLVAHGLIDGVPPMEVETFEEKVVPSPLTSSDRQRLELLEHQVLELLQLAARFGPVFIVTAASLPWVVASAEHFLPRVRQFLLDNQRQCESKNAGIERVQVVSARDWYHHQIGTGSSQLEWKCATFEALCSHLKLQDVFARLKTRTDLISIGDARFEQEACVRMEMKASEFLRSKTMKFVEQPTLEELLEQLKMMSKMYDPMCQYDGGLHLCVSRKETSSAQDSFGDGGRFVDNALETLQLVQIDRMAALNGSAARDCDARLQQLLAAADSLTHKAHYAGHDHSYQNEPPLAAVPGARN
ncbi:hypothetical protein PPTG_18614 [Phytophthora nicotianae INRA-310]|uniref:Uncharacterized protein n=3 Tax=Phytophthora nicotianae TaxID=4792 RepID=W2PFK5_PHYN3|nr:hypothetical protein PPTG_18614 [Phytophthora nicotianae INRA-310]ETM32160.1 hypothetical protein L914_20388 [Phytophthora nicotianae]ETM99802.1 hypothetical protein PPTG_18614 [Phytophthora nicotianae INRA-310]KUF78619.1 kinase protein [Phytophthora nicotianae]